MAYPITSTPPILRRSFGEAAEQSADTSPLLLFDVGMSPQHGDKQDKDMVRAWVSDNGPRFFCPPRSFRLLSLGVRGKR